MRFGICRTRVDATLGKEISNEDHHARSITAGRHWDWMHHCTARASRFDVRFAELFRYQLRQGTGSLYDKEPRWQSGQSTVLAYGGAARGRCVSVTTQGRQLQGLS